MIQRLLLALLVLPLLAYSETENTSPKVWDIGLRKIIYSPEFKSEVIKLTISQNSDSEEELSSVSLIKGEDATAFPFIYGKVMNQDRAFLKPAFIADSLYTWDHCEIWEPQAYKTETGSVISFKIVEPDTEQIRILKFEFTEISLSESNTLVANSHR